MPKKRKAGSIKRRVPAATVRPRSTLGEGVSLGRQAAKSRAAREKILGATLEIIKQGGYTIYASEVERTLTAHPAVQEAAVVAAPGRDDEIEAFVVLRAAVDSGDLANHCRLRLAAFKRPQRITIVTTLPHNAAGKVMKAALTEKE